MLTNRSADACGTAPRIPVTGMEGKGMEGREEGRRDVVPIHLQSVTRGLATGGELAPITSPTMDGRSADSIGGGR